MNVLSTVNNVSFIVFIAMIVIAILLMILKAIKAAQNDTFGYSRIHGILMIVKLLTIVSFLVFIVTKLI